MPDVRNCRRCGKLYNHIGGEPICPVCRQQDEEDFKRVKEYLYDNPGASMSQISSELEISIERIKRYLREGRLEILNEEGNLFLECEMCGKAIKSGRFCEECERSLSRDLRFTASQMNQKISDSPETRAGSSMLRYLHKEVKKTDGK